ncbi:IclR family transcriptional regulator [Tardiphaga sp. 866_E4_N2_1]|uniref:IclR family transcriptional regulator n=1 Tax=unclassified Tardiphaga TaxID=2631404 RepID=UPI003F27DCAC
MSKVASETGGSQTVDRALAVLQIIVANEQPVLLEDLARRAGLNGGVVYRLVRSLVAAGFAYRSESGGYGVGAELVSISVLVSSRIDLRRAMRPIMQAIVDQFGETASLHVQSGEKRICVEVVDGTHAVRRVVPIGESLPLYAGETGRVFLSLLPDPEQKTFIQLAVASGISEALLIRDISFVRRKGFFIGVGERTPNVGAVSVAINSPDGLLGVLTISGPASRWTRNAMEQAVPQIIELVKSRSIAHGDGK